VQFDLIQKLNQLGHKVSDEGFDYYEVDDPEAFLDQVVLSGYLLHGTNLKLSELEPRQANDKYRESGRRIAIYMTNEPPIAMFSALRGAIHRGWSQHGVNREEKDGKMVSKRFNFGAQHPEQLATQGFVYIFAPNQADEHLGGDEYLSYKSQKPLAAVSIKRSDFAYPISNVETKFGN